MHRFNPDTIDKNFEQDILLDSCIGKQFSFTSDVFEGYLHQHYDKIWLCGECKDEFSEFELSILFNNIGKLLVKKSLIGIRGLYIFSPNKK